MIIKSFGCSFVFGSDLSDLPITKVLVSPVGTFSRLTWPAVLASKKGCDYECHARPGSGNLQIAERVLNECTHDSNSFYVIDWTWIDRFDYIASEDFWQPWGTLRPTSEEDPARSYYKNLHSEYMDKLLTLIYIKTVLNKLLEKRIKFIMTYEDELIFDQRWHVSPAVKELQDSLSDHMTKFEGQTFLQWSRSNGYPESPNWHPLEQAHQAAADYIINHLKGEV
jgi:hypothetical protein